MDKRLLLPVLGLPLRLPLQGCYQTTQQVYDRLQIRFSGGSEAYVGKQSTTFELAALGAMLTEKNPSGPAAASLRALWDKLKPDMERLVIRACASATAPVMLTACLVSLKTNSTQPTPR